MNLSLPPFAGVLRSGENGPQYPVPESDEIDEPAILDQAIARIPQEVKENTPC